MSELWIVRDGAAGDLWKVILRLLIFNGVAGVCEQSTDGYLAFVDQNGD